MVAYPITNTTTPNQKRATMKDADYQAWLESHPKCQRCNDPILKENYKGANYFARLFQEKTIVTSKFKFFMERIDITKPHPSDQTRWINTEFDQIGRASCREGSQL